MLSIESFDINETLRMKKKFISKLSFFLVFTYLGLKWLRKGDFLGTKIGNFNYWKTRLLP